MHLPFSRKLEEEADEVGMTMAAKVRRNHVVTLLVINVDFLEKTFSTAVLLIFRLSKVGEKFTV